MVNMIDVYSEHGVDTKCPIRKEKVKMAVNEYLILNEKQSKRLNKIIKFNDQNPNKYCWPDLYDMAISEKSDDRKIYKESAQNTSLCLKVAFESGSCWCGKFKKDVDA